ncbi:MAG: hypothetical protein ACTSYC_05020 [Promethearchaeota archaeon]
MSKINGENLFIECLWILDSHSGICIFEQNYVDLTKDNVSVDIISSFFSAILSIAQESFVDQIQYIKFSKRKVFFKFHEDLLFIISVKDTPPFHDLWVQKTIQQIAEKFVAKYSPQIMNFEGNISEFNGFSKDLEEIVNEKPLPLRILQVEQLKEGFKKFISFQIQQYKKRKKYFEKIVKQIKKDFIDNYRYLKKF